MTLGMQDKRCRSRFKFWLQGVGHIAQFNDHPSAGKPIVGYRTRQDENLHDKELMIVLNSCPGGEIETSYIEVEDTYIRVNLWADTSIMQTLLMNRQFCGSDDGLLMDVWLEHELIDDWTMTAHYGVKGYSFSQR